MNVFASLMENFETARKSLDTSLSSSGSAMKEHSKWSESLEAKTLKLKAAWQGLSQTFLDSDFLKVAIDFIIDLVSAIDKLVDNIGALGTIGLGFGIFSLFKSGKSILGDLSAFGSTVVDVINSSDKLGKKFKDVGSAAGMAGGSIAKGLTSSLSGTIGVIGLVVAGVGLAINAYKNYREEISKARQEVIQSSDDFLNAAGSFEQAYIKYSGRTDLTAEEESELESAIKGTVDALGDKSSALQQAVNSSNDYIDSLERIAKEELKAAETAAKAKRDKAALELEDAAMGYERWDGSEVDVELFDDKAVEIAKEIGDNYFEDYRYSSEGVVVSHVQELSLSKDANVDEIVEYYNFLVKYQEKLSDADLADTEDYKNVSDAIERMSEAVKVYTDGVYDAVKAEYQLANGIPKTTEEYVKMRESILKSEDIKGLSFDTRKTILNTLDSEYGQIFDLTSAEIQARKFVGLIKGYGDGTKDGTNEIGTVETFLNVRTALNNNECTIGQYLSELNNMTSMAEKFSEEEREEFNLAFGIDSDSIKEQYKDVYNYISRNYLEKLDITSLNKFNVQQYEEQEVQKIKDILNNLTLNELRAVANIKAEINWETSSKDEILAQIENEAKFIEAMDFTIAIDVETEGLTAFNTAMSESVSGIGLSSESISALKSRYSELASQGYDLSSMFEETSNGIHLNREAINEFEKALASQKLSETDDKLDILKGRYDELTKEIEDCTDAGERAHLYSEQQQVAQKINDLATLASQYEGLTSAYNAWQNAESAGSERDMYESIISGFENVGDEIKRGWMDDGTIEFLKLLYGDKTTITKIVDGKKVKEEIDIATASAADLKQAYKELDQVIEGTAEGKHKGYSISDFFTVDEDGNSTSQGVYNFLDAIGHMEEEVFGNKDIVKRKNGKIVSFDFNLVAEKDKNGNVIKNGDKVIAEALGISEELVQIMQRAADDAGFVVTLDGSYTQLADLKTFAEESNNALKKLQSEGLDNLKDIDLNFDFGVNTIEGYQEQLEKATNVLDKFRDKNGKLKTDSSGNLIKGAQEALDIAGYYTVAMDKLTEPKFMQIDTSEVDAELKEPIEKMQKIGDLCKEKHLVSLTGDTEDLKEVQDKINIVAKEIEELKPEVKAQIGIDENWDSKTIADKIEKGEIEIPAELKIDVQISEDLKDMRLMMMRQLGLVDDNEVKLKIGYELDDSVVDKLDDKKREIVIKYIEENKEVWEKLSKDDREIIVELIASGVDLETLTNKEEIIVDFVAKNEKQFEKLEDEEKQVVVDLVTDDSALKAFEDYGVEIEAFCNIFGVEKVDDLKKRLEGLDDEQILVVAQVLGKVKVDDLKKAMDGLEDEDVKAIAEAIGKGDVDALKTAVFNLEDKEIEAIAKALGHEDVDGLKSAMDKLTDKDVQAIAQTLGITDVDSLKAAIDRLSNKDVKAVANVDGKDDVNGLQSAIDNLKGKTVTVWASIKKKASDLWDKLTGGGGVDGTAHVNGTAFSNGTTGRAFKQGSWGTKDSGIALGGEVAPELLVRNGRWHLIGEKGAEFFGYKKGDIIFNGDQTKEIFEKGKITHGNGRGKALVSGTAFSEGINGGIETEVESTSVTKKSSSSSSEKKSSSSSAADEFEETLDFIEIAISRIERAIDRLDTKANSVYRIWSERNSNLTKEISKVNEEISLQQQAYNAYMKEANSVGLSSSWAAKIRNGTLDVTTITNEDLADKIKKYQEFYEKALDCQDAILELQETESKLYEQRFDNVQTQYDGVLQGYEHTEKMLNEYISQAEEQGYIISKKYYQALIDNEESNIAQLKKEQKALLDARDEAVANGAIARESEAWYSMCQEIDSVTQAIEESTTALLEFDNAMRDIDWQIFDLIQERISNVSEENEFFVELLSNKKLYEDDGKLTSQGLATMALHASSYNTNMYQADLAGEEAEKLRKQLENDPYDTALEERYREMIALQREYILEAENSKNAIVDMVENGIELELEALDEKIQKYEEALDSQKDLYDYEKTVSEKTQNISSLKKQISAYSNDNSEEAKTKIQELQLELRNAEDDLAETEFDRLIENTQQLTDALYEQYSELLNQRLDNIDVLLEQVIESINTVAGVDGVITTALGSEGALSIAIGNNAVSIKDTLTSEANKVGTTLSTAMNNIWNTGEGNAKSVLTMYGEDFKSKSTTLNNTLNSIKVSVNSVVSSLNKEAEKKVTANKTTTSAKKDPTKSSTSSKTSSSTTSKTTKSSGDGVAKIGDKVKFVSGQYYYDSQGKKPLGSKNRGKQVYITNVNKKSWATHPYHISTGNKLGKGDLGWLKLNQLSGYAFGKKKLTENELAWTQEGRKQEYIVRPSDGAILTPVAKGDSVLNAMASRNIWDMANSPTEFIKDSLGIGATNVPNNSNVQSNCVQNFDKIVFNMPNVKNYDEMLSAMKKDKNFERLVESITIDPIVGKSSLTKGKSIR